MGASAAAARQLLEAAGVLELIAVVVGGDEIERPKPDPEGVKRACGFLGVSPSEAAYTARVPTQLRPRPPSGNALG